MNGKTFAVTRHPSPLTNDCGHKLGLYMKRTDFDDIRMQARYENYTPLNVIGDFLAVNHEEAGDTASTAAWRAWAREPNGMFAQAWVSCVGKKRG